MICMHLSNKLTSMEEISLSNKHDVSQDDINDTEEEDGEDMYILVDFPDLPLGSTLLSDPRAISFHVFFFLFSFIASYHHTFLSAFL